MDDSLLEKPSGTFRPLAVPGLLGAGVATALLFGGLYGALNFYSPVYLDLPLLVTAGVGLGLVMLKLARLFYVRSTGLAVTCGGLAGVAAAYGAWVVWVFLVFRGASSQMLLFSPEKLAVVAERLTDGTLPIATDLSADGVLVKALWGAEVLAWFGLAISFVALRLSRVPFSASAGRWATERSELPPLAAVPASARKAFVADLSQGGVRANVAIRKLKPVPAGAMSFMMATGRTTNPPGDEVFLTLEAVDFAGANKASAKVRRTVLARDLKVDVAAWSELVKSGSGVGGTGEAAAARANVSAADDDDPVEVRSFPGLGPASESEPPAPRPVRPADAEAVAAESALAPLSPAVLDKPAAADTPPATFLKHDPDDTAASPHGLPGMPPAA